MSDKRPTLSEMLRATYDPLPGRAREWAVFEEVTLGMRRMDFLAVNLWASRGHEIRGHEMKEGRGDWLKELAEPAKAEGLARFVDSWWVVAPTDVVYPEELPGEAQREYGRRSRGGKAETLDARLVRLAAERREILGRTVAAGGATGG